MKKIIYLLSIILVLISCKKQTNENYKIPINLEPNNNSETEKLFSISNITPLETSDSCLLGRITKVFFQKNKLSVFVKRQKEILQFGYDGKFIQKMHKIGRGPGEYRFIADCAIDLNTDNISIINAGHLKEYTTNGKFIKSFKVFDEEISAVNRIAIINDSTVALFAMFNDKDCLTYSKKTETFTTKTSITPLWARENIPFTSGKYFYKNQNILNHFEGFSNKVYSVDEKGYHLKYEWDFGMYNFEYEKSPLIDILKKSSSRENQKKLNYYLEKYALLFQHNIENEKYIITCFVHKNKTTTLIYNKTNKKYKVFTDDVSILIMSSIFDFTDTNKLILVTKPSILKFIPKDMLSKQLKEVVNRVDDSNNPLLIKLNFNEDLF